MNRLIFAIIISLLAVPTSAHARVWYDGGVRDVDSGGLLGTGDCSVTNESPAEKYAQLGGRLVDKGDTVEVLTGYFKLSYAYIYFRSKAVCERVKAANERKAAQEKERLNPYR